MSTSSTNTAYLKPLITGAVAVAGDKFLFNEPDMQKSIYFGVAVGAGSFAGNYIGSNIAPALLPPYSRLYRWKNIRSKTC